MLIAAVSKVPVPIYAIPFIRHHFPKPSHFERATPRAPIRYVQIRSRYLVNRTRHSDVG
jgi:hypothetical protein